MTETMHDSTKLELARPALAGRASLSKAERCARIAERCYPVAPLSLAQVRFNAQPGSGHTAWPADRGRPGSVFGVLRTLGWHGGIEQVAAGLLTLAAQRSVPVDLILGSLVAGDLPALGTSERRRLLTEALRRVIWRVGSDGRLDDLARCFGGAAGRPSAARNFVGGTPSRS